MAHSPETKRALRSAYVYQSLGLEVAAERMSISFGTASRWKREAKADGDDWDKARAAKMLSAEGADAVVQAVLEDFVLVFKSTITQLKEGEAIPPLAKADAMAKLSDAFHKTMAAARKGSPEVNKLAIGMDFIKILADFVSDNYPQHAAAFIEILEPFGQHLTQALVK